MRMGTTHHWIQPNKTYWLLLVNIRPMRFNNIRGGYPIIFHVISISYAIKYPTSHGPVVSDGPDGPDGPVKNQHDNTTCRPGPTHRLTAASPRWSLWWSAVWVTWSISLLTSSFVAAPWCGKIWTLGNLGNLGNPVAESRKAEKKGDEEKWLGESDHVSTINFDE